MKTLIALKRCILLTAFTFGIASTMLGNQAHAAPSTICADGTYSYSSGSGTCSWHGGVAGDSSLADYLRSLREESYSSGYATTLCEDGTFSSSTGSGTCSWHGGIAGGSDDESSGSGSSSYYSYPTAPREKKSALEEWIATHQGLAWLIGLGAAAGIISVISDMIDSSKKS